LLLGLHWLTFRTDGSGGSHHCRIHGRTHVARHRSDHSGRCRHRLAHFLRFARLTRRPRFARFALLAWFTRGARLLLLTLLPGLLALTLTLTLTLGLCAFAARLAITAATLAFFTTALLRLL